MSIRKSVYIALLFVALGQVKTATGAEVYCAQYMHIPTTQEETATVEDMFRFPSHGIPTPNTCASIEIEGEIQKGDAEKFLAILHQSHPYLSSVQLNSQGGSVSEAFRIGHLIRTNMLYTSAPTATSEARCEGDSSNCNVSTESAWEFQESKTGQLRQSFGDLQCSSSCFLIWSAGIDRTGDVIGIHRPTLTSPDFNSLPPDEASKSYTDALRSIKTYLEEMEIPSRYIESMVDTSSQEIRKLSKEEARELEYPPSIIEPMINVKVCGKQPNTDELKELRVFRGCFLMRMSNFRDALRGPNE